MPLRQLSKEEVFERDEAVIGDRRRRISGESLVVEFEVCITLLSSGYFMVMTGNSRH